MGQSKGSACQLAFVYVGTVVGAGFATGREIVEFFLKFGWPGLFGILVSGGMFTFLGAKMMIISKRINAKSYQEMNIYLFGAQAGRVINVFMLFVLLGVTSVMLSGAGAIFEEQLGMSTQVGMLITIGLSLFVMTTGVKGIFGVNIFVVPLLILFSMIVVADSFIFSETRSAVEWVWPHKWDWLLSAVSYGALNLSLAQAVLVPLANEIPSERVIKKGALLGGVMLTMVLAASFLSLSVLPDVLLYDIPMAQVVFLVARSVHIIYLFIIFGEVFTSVIGNLYGLEKQMKSFLHIKSKYIFAGIMLTAYLTSQIGYGKLISTIYPLFGYVSLAFIGALVYKKIPQK
ncbi:MAG: YkvI family membrane protein [Bacillota bacterium]